MSKWNSLEVTKILVSILTPVAIVWFSVEASKQSSILESERNRLNLLASQMEIHRKYVADQRSDLWRHVSGPLNDIYAYFLYVGHWKELSERDIISAKRKLDKIIYSNRPFFSDEFFNSYIYFTKQTFEPYGGWGKDARLRTKNLRDSDAGVDDARFTGEDNGNAIHSAYFELLKVVGSELNLVFNYKGAPRTPEDRSDIE